MTPLVPIMLFGWVPFTIFLFYRLPPHRAVLVSVIGGWLLLPMAGYNLPGLPPYSKGTAIAVGLILGGRFSGQRQRVSFEWKLHDLPMILWCLSPIPTSLANQLGLYDGLSGVFGQIVTWGVPYLAGRIYFTSPETLHDLCLGIIVGGLLYIPLCLYEMRMSPRLSINFYGIFPHEWRQHYRYGGWRPIVFMQHGLMVSLWMSVSSTVAFWFWRSRYIDRLIGMPVSLIAMASILTAVLCKSGNGWFSLALGCGSYFFFRCLKSRLPFLLLFLSIPLYMSFRLEGFFSGQDIEMLAAHFFDDERVSSLGIRLFQEDLFIRRAMESPLFGWGGYSRGWPVDPTTGKQLIKMVDPLWIITFSSKGFLGIFTLLPALLIGPWLIFRSNKKEMHLRDINVFIPIILSIVVILFMIDSLFNAMVNPAYIMSSGAILSWHLTQSRLLQN